MLYIAELVLLFGGINGLRDPFIYSSVKSEEKIDVKETTSSHIGRYKRRTKPMFPEILRFDLIGDYGNKANIVLKQSPAVVKDVPVFAIKNGKIVREKLQTKNKDRVYFYQDVRHLAAIGIQIMEIGNKSQYALSGTIHLEGVQHIIRHRSADGNVHHFISKITENITFGEDFVVDEYREPIKQKTKKVAKSASNVYNVELLVVADFAVYNYWNTRSTVTDATEKDIEVKTNIVEYYSYIINAIDVVYDSISGTNWDINVVFAGIIIIDSSTSFDVTESIKISNTYVHGETVLRSFGVWLEDNKSEMPTYDHAMLFTGYDMYSDIYTSPGLLGIAWVSRLCSRDSSNTYLENSVVEDSFGGRVALVAAHELGHNIGSWHDGSQGNLCSPYDKYNMAPYIGASEGDVGKNIYTFSSCSITYFNDYIDELNDNNANCMKTFGPEYDANWFDEYQSTLYGQVYSIEEQCKKLSPHGDDSSACQSLYQGNLPALCRYVYCDNGNSVCSRYFPFEGTQCGEGKLCKGGECITDSRAANVPESCVFGDDPSFTLNGQKCEALLKSTSSPCYDMSVKTACCWTCAKRNSGISDCEYGDHITSCSLPDCASITNSDCCHTCQNSVDETTASNSRTDPKDNASVPSGTNTTWVVVGSVFAVVAVIGIVIIFIKCLKPSTTRVQPFAL